MTLKSTLDLKCHFQAYDDWYDKIETKIEYRSYDSLTANLAS